MGKLFWYKRPFSYLKGFYSPAFSKQPPILVLIFGTFLTRKRSASLTPTPEEPHLSQNGMKTIIYIYPPPLWLFQNNMMTCSTSYIWDWNNKKEFGFTSSSHSLIYYNLMGKACPLGPYHAESVISKVIYWPDFSTYAQHTRHQLSFTCILPGWPALVYLYKIGWALGIGTKSTSFINTKSVCALSKAVFLR